VSVLQHACRNYSMLTKRHTPSDQEVVPFFTQQYEDFDSALLAFSLILGTCSIGLLNILTEIVILQNPGLARVAGPAGHTGEEN